ncbi:DUF4222 domain-containing protein [Erwinia psidii]|uniref:DUF4222 domain-containing protein n=1 Tax=Erwinia psidii TaxID=69224 RepID=UPI00226B99A0|nr:DUF4222 domain-containing protein [Erwinia psidii]MCX8967141.1 DUF4222 domain-containing protein [Erwinia psidii]
MAEIAAIPLPGQRYQDKRGDHVTVQYVEYGLVTFLRDGYYGQCVAPLERFMKAFTRLNGGQHG